MRFYVISLFLMVCNFWIIVIILELKFPSSIFLQGCICGQIIFELRYIFSSLCMLIENFVWGSSLGEKIGFFLFIHCKISYLLPFRISVKKSGTTLICLPLQVNCPFPLPSFNLSFPEDVFAFIIMWWGALLFLVQYNLSSVSILYIYRCFLGQVWNFIYDSVEGIFWPLELRFFSFFYSYYSQLRSFYGFPVLWMICVRNFQI